MSPRPPRALVLGASGQVGICLVNAAPPGWDVQAPGRAELDLAQASRVEEVVRRHAPDVVLNAAAYTAVDAAEDNPALAHAINATGAGLVATAAAACGAALVHVSTDYVFGGNRGMPWRADDPTGPLGVYGSSKLAGELEVHAAHPAACIMRTSWVYSGLRQDFVLTMLRLLAEREEVRVVSDQVGSPTWARALATALWQAALLKVDGVHHWADAGAASWYDFAVAIREEALAAGVLTRAGRVTPIGTAEYPTRARRPAMSLLATGPTRKRLGLEAAHWRENLRTMLQERVNA